MLMSSGTVTLYAGCGEIYNTDWDDTAIKGKYTSDLYPDSFPTPTVEDPATSFIGWY